MTSRIPRHERAGSGFGFAQHWRHGVLDGAADEFAGHEGSVMAGSKISSRGLELSLAESSGLPRRSAGDSRAVSLPARCRVPPQPQLPRACSGVGARLLQPAADPTAQDEFIVYADRAGHPFCLCWHAKDTG